MVVVGRNRNKFLCITFIYLLNEVVDGKAKESHEQTKDENEHPVNDVWENLCGHPVPCS